MVRDFGLQELHDAVISPYDNEDGLWDRDTLNRSPGGNVRLPPAYHRMYSLLFGCVGLFRDVFWVLMLRDGPQPAIYEHSQADILAEAVRLYLSLFMCSHPLLYIMSLCLPNRIIFLYWKMCIV